MPFHRIQSVVVVSSIIIASLLSKGVLADTQPLVHEGVINAPIEQVWEAWTTAEGLESWMVAHAEIDLRLGGLMRTVYNPNDSLGGESTIENTIISFVPNRMLSFRNTRAPANFPFAKAIENMWTVLIFEPLDENHTHLTVTCMGFGEDEQSQQMRAFFAAGNQWTVQKLQQKFADSADSDSANTGKQGAASDPDATLKLLHQFAGGEWIVENKRPDGSVFRSRSVYEMGPDDVSITAHGWLGDADGMYYHGATQIWREPSGANQPITVRFQSVNESGTLARGEIGLLDERTLVWDWNARSLAGTLQHYEVHQTLESPDRFRFVLFLKESKEAKRQLVDVRYTRVAESPEIFRKLKSPRAQANER